eukprot:1513407-Prymnesium_polylepis.1
MRVERGGGPAQNHHSPAPQSSHTLLGILVQIGDPDRVWGDLWNGTPHLELRGADFLVHTDSARTRLPSTP